ncbi:hypothetical protein BHE74_00054434 [Ensete ventricosum]|nr:hypothetical protein BHE74_00054434 [Ensete ventricosum]
MDVRCFVYVVVANLSFEMVVTLSIFTVKAARRRGSQPRPAPMQVRPPTVRSRQRPTRKGGQRQGRQPLAGAAAHRGDTCGQKRCSKRGPTAGRRKELPPASSPVASRAAAPSTGVAAPWQGDCQQARAAAAYAGATTVTVAA